MPMGLDPRLVGQTRRIITHIGPAREITIDLPFVPSVEPGCEYQISSKVGTKFRLLVPPGMEADQIEEFPIPAMPERGRRAKFHEWSIETRNIAKRRVAKETHFPAERDAPATADANIPRFIEIQTIQDQLTESKTVGNLQFRTHPRKLTRAPTHAYAHAFEPKGLKRAEFSVENQATRRSNIGKRDKLEGTLRMTGKDIRTWQRTWHEDLVDRKVAVARLEAEDKARTGEKWQKRLDEHGEDTVMGQEIFRAEVFHPGAGARILQRHGIALEDDASDVASDSDSSGHEFQNGLAVPSPTRYGLPTLGKNLRQGDHDRSLSGAVHTNGTNGHASDPEISNGMHPRHAKARVAMPGGGTFWENVEASIDVGGGQGDPAMVESVKKRAGALGGRGAAARRARLRDEVYDEVAV